jgi:predicted RNase H-like HicB family nuclease
MMFRDRTTENEYVYVAITPELDGCVAQGDTLKEARENLRAFRVDYIEHLLENHLSVPAPAAMVARTEANSVKLPSGQSNTTDSDSSGQSSDREKLFDAQFRIEYDPVR